jgi:hypothetical protein
MIAVLPDSASVAEVHSRYPLTHHFALAVLKSCSTMLQRLRERLHIKEPGEQRGGLCAAMRRQVHESLRTFG